MKVYLITEEEKQALLKDLELIKLRVPDQFAATPEERDAQKRVAEHMHHIFHVTVCRHLN